jgi:hypothetical protein
MAHSSNYSYLCVSVELFAILSDANILVFLIISYI